MNGEREVYVNLNLSKTDRFCQTKTEIKQIKLNPKYQYPSSKLGGNSIWQILNIPLTYIWGSDLIFNNKERKNVCCCDDEYKIRHFLALLFLLDLQPS